MEAEIENLKRANEALLNGIKSVQEMKLNLDIMSEEYEKFKTEIREDLTIIKSQLIDGGYSESSVIITSINILINKTYGLK